MSGETNQPLFFFSIIMPSKKTAKAEKVSAKTEKARDKKSKPTKGDRTKGQPAVYDVHPTPAKPKSREDKKAARKAKKAAKRRGVGVEQTPEAQGPPPPTSTNSPPLRKSPRKRAKFKVKRDLYP